MPSPACLEEPSIKLETQSSRIDMVTSLHLEKDLIRAIPLHVSLRQAGLIWRRPLLKMSTEELATLYDWSQPAVQYDIFLSHTWETSGGQKYLSLLIYSSRFYLLLCWFLAVALASFCFVYFELPTYGHVNPQALGWRKQGGCATGPWIICAGFISMILGLLTAPYLQCRLSL